MELTQRVEQISALVRDLHQAGVEGAKTRELLNSIFRSVHSLKAAAAAEGFNDLSRLAHEFENVLHSLRTGKLKLDEQVLRVFDDTIVALSAGFNKNVIESPLLDRFSALPISQPTEISPLLSMLPPDVAASLKDEERHRAAAAAGEGSNLYVMEAVFETTDFDLRFRNLKEQLNKVGEVISASARVTDDQALRISFRVIYAAKAEKIRLDEILQRAVRAGKSAANSLGKEVEFSVTGDDLLLDKSFADALADPLLHLVRNAVDHGVASRGNVTIEATTASGQVQITVTDDGRGIDPANIPRLFQPGFSTATEVTEFSGRGVGLDVVATAVRELGGTVTVTSELGKGTSFTIALPL